PVYEAARVHCCWRSGCGLAARGEGATDDESGDRILDGRRQCPKPLILAPLHRGLRELGYVEGQNVAIEYRWGATRADRQREYATDLVRQQVAVILASNDGPALAATRDTSTIPIVFTNIYYDPVTLGLVARL